MVLFHFGGVKMVASKETVEMLLTPKEYKVIMLRNSDQPKTLEVTGKELGVTRERIRQIEAKALQKIYQFVSRN